MIDWKDYTNRRNEWEMLGLDKLKCALWYMAIQQIEYLCTQDPYEISEKIKPITEPNR